MGESKHTPGPWAEDFFGDRFPISAEAERFRADMVAKYILLFRADLKGRRPGRSAWKAFYRTSRGSCRAMAGAFHHAQERASK
jgi:hypothetical protein